MTDFTHPASSMRYTRGRAIPLHLKGALRDLLDAAGNAQAVHRSMSVS